MAANVVAEAREWLGTRYRHQASVKGIGVDCIGLVAGVAAAVGIPEAFAWAGDQRRKSYGRQPDPRMLLHAVDDYLERVSEPDVGDLLLMRFKPDEPPQHFAIVSAVDPIYIIHAYAAARRVVENRLDELWASRIVAAYRFKT